MSHAEEVVPDWSDPALYIELFVDRRQHLTMFLEHQIMTHVSSPSLTSLPPPSLSPPSSLFSLPSSAYGSSLFSLPSLLPPTPQKDGNLRDVIFTTLLELYLADIGTCRTPEDRHSKEKRALELMQRKNATFDLDHALGNPRQPSYRV